MRISIEFNDSINIDKYTSLLNLSGYQINRYDNNFHLSLTDLLSHLMFFSKIKNDFQIVLGSPYSLKFIYGQILLDKKIMSLKDFKIFEQYIETIGWEPDIIIYLYNYPVSNIHEIVLNEINCHIPIYKICIMDEDNVIVSQIKEIIEKYKNL